MAKALKLVTFLLVTAALLLILACCLHSDPLLLTLAIAVGTTAYHFAGRLAVGWAVNRTMRNHADLTRSLYQPRGWEPPLYELLRVRRWKQYMPTLDPNAFSPAHHTWHEIAQAMCQSEIVHLLCAVCSLLPLVLIIPFGQPLVFILTSVLGALFDLSLVAVQRYNRPTVLRLAQRAAHQAK